MVSLIAILQTFQDLHGLFLRRLSHHNRLEATLQRGILLNVLAVLIDSSCTNHLEITPGQSGLQDVGSVCRTFRSASTDNRMQLINEEDDVAVSFYLVNCGLDPLLKVSTILGASHHAGQIQGNQALVFQDLRHLARLDLQGQALCHSGFAHTGFTDEHRVVLGAAAQDLDDTLNFSLAANDRVNLPLGCQLGQVAPELLQRLAIALLALFPAAGTSVVFVAKARVVQHGGKLRNNPVGIGTQNLQEPHGVTLAVLNDGNEQVLGSHIGIVELCTGHCGHL